MNDDEQNSAGCREIPRKMSTEEWTSTKHFDDILQRWILQDAVISVALESKGSTAVPQPYKV